MVWVVIPCAKLPNSEQVAVQVFNLDRWEKEPRLIFHSTMFSTTPAFYPTKRKSLFSEFKNFGRMRMMIMPKSLMEAFAEELMIYCFISFQDMGEMNY